MSPTDLAELLKLPASERAELAITLWESLTDQERDAELRLGPERRAELEGFAAVMEGVRNAAERLKGRAIAGPHDYDQIPALVERSKLRVKDFYADLNARLTEDPFVAGNHFSAADITALVTVDFATKGMSFAAPGEHRALNNWYEKVSSRPSAKA